MYIFMYKSIDYASAISIVRFCDCRLETTDFQISTYECERECLRDIVSFLFRRETVRNG